MRVLDYTEVRGNLNKVIDETIEYSDITTIHRPDGEAVVLMSQSDDNSLVETLHLLSTPANAASLARAIAQDRAYQSAHNK